MGAEKNALVCFGLDIKQYYTSKGAYLLILTLQSIAILICKCDLDFIRGGHWQYTSRNLSSCKDTDYRLYRGYAHVSLVVKKTVILYQYTAKGDTF